MTSATIASALQRVRVLLTRRPHAAIHADEPAIARWDEGARVITRHANGMHVVTDMPAELGGAGDQASPGWLLRAALASCLATRIAMEAAARSIAVARLEVIAASHSDARGLLGMRDHEGERIPAAPCEVRLQVSIAATNVAGDVLKDMIEESQRCSPVCAAVERSVPVSLEIKVDPN